MNIKNWNELSQAEQDLYLTLLWKDGYSEGAMAKFFSTTKGRMVRRRNTLNLTSSGRPATKQKVDPERFQDLLDLHAMNELEKEGVAVIAPPQPAPEVTTCQWPLATLVGKKAKLCGKPVVPGHKLCEEHLEQTRLKHL